MGDQSWPTKRGNDVTEANNIVEQSSFVCGGTEGQLSQQEQQEVKEAGFLTGQTDKQTTMMRDDEDKETSLVGLTPGT